VDFPADARQCPGANGGLKTERKMRLFTFTHMTFRARNWKPRKSETASDFFELRMSGTDPRAMTMDGRRFVCKLNADFSPIYV
jgi:hypothetical protein